MNRKDVVQPGPARKASMGKHTTATAGATKLQQAEAGVPASGTFALARNESKGSRSNSPTATRPGFSDNLKPVVLTQAQAAKEETDQQDPPQVALHADLAQGPAAAAQLPVCETERAVRARNREMQKLHLLSTTFKPEIEKAETEPGQEEEAGAAGSSNGAETTGKIKIEEPEAGGSARSSKTVADSTETNVWVQRLDNAGISSKVATNDAPVVPDATTGPDPSGAAAAGAAEPGGAPAADGAPAAADADVPGVVPAGGQLIMVPRVAAQRGLVAGGAAKLPPLVPGGEAASALEAARTGKVTGHAVATKHGASSAASSLEVPRKLLGEDTAPGSLAGVPELRRTNRPKKTLSASSLGAARSSEGKAPPTASGRCRSVGRRSAGPSNKVSNARTEAEARALMGLDGTSWSRPSAARSKKVSGNKEEDNARPDLNAAMRAALQAGLGGAPGRGHGDGARRASQQSMRRGSRTAPSSNAGVQFESQSGGTSTRAPGPVAMMQFSNKEQAKLVAALIATLEDIARDRMMAPLEPPAQLVSAPLAAAQVQADPLLEAPAGHVAAPLPANPVQADPLLEAPAGHVAEPLAAAPVQAGALLEPAEFAQDAVEAAVVFDQMAGPLEDCSSPAVSLTSLLGLNNVPALEMLFDDFEASSTALAAALAALVVPGFPTARRERAEEPVFHPLPFMGSSGSEGSVGSGAHSPNAPPAGLNPGAVDGTPLGVQEHAPATQFPKVSAEAEESPVLLFMNKTHPSEDGYVP